MQWVLGRLRGVVVAVLAGAGATFTAGGFGLPSPPSVGLGVALLTMALVIATGL